MMSAPALTQERPPQDPAPQQPTFRARVDSVSVDVIVLDKAGKPVTDLKPEEFEIRESNKIQKIETFKLIQTDTGRDGPPLREILSVQDQQREVVNDQNRLFAIFLDDYHVRRTNSLRVRESLGRFVSQLSPRDLVAVSYPLTPAGALTFSRNHDGTAAAIANFEGRKYDYTPRNPFEERYQLQPPELLERMRNELTISGLESLCTFMGSLREGRKTVLFVSEGLSGTLPVGVRTSGNIIGASPVPQTSSQAFFNSADLLGQFRMLFVAASRANTSIYTFDPRGLATGEFDLADRVAGEADRQVMTESLDSLRIIADSTDGRAIVNRNDPIPDLRRMVQDNSAYYLLGYTTTVAPRDGKFHEIQVRVKRRDVDVRARKGYWAYSAEDAERASAPPKPSAPRDVVTALDDLAGVVEPASRSPVVLWMGATRGPDAGGKAKVTFAWEPSPGTPDPNEVVDRVNVTATSIYGDLLFKGPVAKDPQALSALGPVVDALEELGVRYYVGGSLASSTHGVPRASIAADVVADLRLDHVAPLVNRLQGGYYIDEGRVRSAILARRSFNAIHLASMFKVDVFVTKGRPFDEEALKRARPDTLDDAPEARRFLIASPPRKTRSSPSSSGSAWEARCRTASGPTSWGC
jgi:VWFA-related protein